MQEDASRMSQEMDQTDLTLLRALQDGIPIVPHPFKEIGDRLGLDENTVISRLRALRESGVVRRFAATIGHRALGIIANAMIVWKVEDDIERIGCIMASFEEVTHCYQRATCDGWPYNLYTVVHSRSREECEEIASRISEATGVKEYRILFSEKEYKKTSARI
ncbi:MULTISPECIES: siroheme decarboxylase subunit beta [Methanothrix]|uniref:siroheme decarboxylase n=1 Tax=Methanothrix thermoacetophila (strain DSM 6194 / JCM 14653 / NBRC 101360 / PT) TaxID=349307 RepID=A0B576_METTP|nr:MULTISPECIES: siroheme decarboxylase subunit beta [Methanothrix]ABK13850.1 transcriptional regulator, AsnC family [Methanothrix thermoacetophila PT]